MKVHDYVLYMDNNITESTEESVRNIQALLQNKVAARWYQMGIVMGVPLAELEMIRSDQSVQSILEKETAMIKVWLRQSLLPCTWQVLVDAVEHNSGGQNPLLAREVAAEVNITHNGILKRIYQYCRCQVPDLKTRTVENTCTTLPLDINFS